MCVDFVREQFDLFIMLSAGRLKHVYVYMRTTSIILCLKQIIKQLLMYNHNKLDISSHSSSRLKKKKKQITDIMHFWFRNEYNNKKKKSERVMNIYIDLSIYLFLLLFSTINNNYLCKQCILLLLSSPAARR